MLPRNLNRRIEILVPVDDPHLQAELASLLDLLLADNTGAWQLDPAGTWQRVTRAPNQRRRNTQQQLMRRHARQSR